jgi:hypothetical protein
MVPHDPLYNSSASTLRDQLSASSGRARLRRLEARLLDRRNRRHGVGYAVASDLDNKNAES